MQPESTYAISGRRSGCSVRTTDRRRQAVIEASSPVELYRAAYRIRLSPYPLSQGQKQTALWLEGWAGAKSVREGRARARRRRWALYVAYLRQTAPSAATALFLVACIYACVWSLLAALGGQ